MNIDVHDMIDLVLFNVQPEVFQLYSGQYPFRVWTLYM